MIRYEHRSSVSRGGQAGLTQFTIATSQPGYISVWGYPEETAKVIEDQGHTAGLQGLPLYTDLLYLDVDDADETPALVEAVLQEAGIGYQMYFSGNRGVHFHIPCLPLQRADLPRLVSQWVTQQFPFKGMDHSLYKTSGIIRTAGTFHHKRPGSFKKLLTMVSGNSLDLLASLTAPIPTGHRLGGFEADQDSAEVLAALWLVPTYEGDRNRQIYRRAFLAKVAGIDQETTQDNIRLYNELMVSPPLSERELVSTVRSAYR